MKITNYQKQQLKMYFGLKVNLNLTFQEAQDKIIEGEKLAAQKLADNRKMTLGWDGK